MASSQFDWIEYTIFSIMSLLSVIVGIYFVFVKKGKNTVIDYLYGNKNMPVIPIGLSLISSFISGPSLTGVAAEVYVHGAQYLMSCFASLALFVALCYVTIPIFYKLQLASTYEYLEMRFDRRLKLIATISYIFANLGYIPIVIYAAALALNQISSVNIYIISTIICSICIFYTALGGVKAIVWSDSIQTIIMAAAVLAVTGLGLYKTGGLSEVITTASEGGRLEIFDMSLDLTKKMTFWVSTIGISFQFLGSVAVNPAVIQRFLSLPSEKQAKIACIIYFIGGTFFELFSGIISLIMYTYYKNCDPIKAGDVEHADQLMAFFVFDIAKGIKGLSSLYFAGLVCAALSTFSTLLNTVSSIIFYDLIQPLFGKIDDANSSKVLKILVILLGIISTFLVIVVEQLGSILEMFATVEGIIGGPLLGVFILGFFFPKANAKGALWGCLTAFSLILSLSIGYRIYDSKGFIPNDYLPASTDNCPYNTTINMTDIVHEDGYIFPVFLVSLYLYGMIGCITSIVIGLVVSYITGFNDIKTVNKDLLSPLIYKYLPVDETYAAVSLNETI